MADDDLNPYQYRLLGHYIRVEECWESVRTTARITRMSVGMVVKTRQALVDLGYIQVEESEKGTYLVEVIDRMAENVSRYAEQAAKKKQRSSNEQGKNQVKGVHHMNASVHHMNTSKLEGVHQVNQRITITLEEEQKESAAPVGTDSLSGDTLVTNGEALLEQALADVEVSLPIEAALEPPTHADNLPESPKKLPRPRKAKAAPGSDVALRLSKETRDQLMQAACYAFNEPKGGYTAKLGYFFAGMLKKDPDKKSDDLVSWQPDPSATPELIPLEIIGFTLWYARHHDTCKTFAEQKRLPQTPEILRKHWDRWLARIPADPKFYPYWTGEAKPILEGLMRGEKLRPKTYSEPKPGISTESGGTVAPASKTFERSKETAFIDRREEGALDTLGELFGA